MVGYKIAGILGVVVAIVATVIPPFLIISIISMFYIIFRENRYIAFIFRYAIIICTGVCKQSERKYLISTEPDLGNASVGI